MSERYRALSRRYERSRQSFVNPRYLSSELSSDGFVLRVDRGLLTAETSDAKGWCGDHDDVNSSEIVTSGAVDSIALSEDVELLCMVTLFMDVADT